MAGLPFRFYLVTNRHLCPGGDLSKIVREACSAGVKAVQLREKDLRPRELLELGYTIKGITEEHGSLLFINDRIDVAKALGAQGLHLPSGSLPPNELRKGWEPGLIGVSTHNLEEAVRAEEEGADFVLLGPIFPTPSKEGILEPLGLNTLEEVAKELKIPVLAIGGVKPKEAKRCKEVGAWGVAAISSIMASTNVRGTLAQYEEALGTL